MGYVQYIVRADGSQTPHGQGRDLIDVVQVQVADALQAGLHDLLEALVALAGAVDGLIIIHFARAGLVLSRVLDDGEGHVGHEGHEDAAGVGERDHPVADQKVFVSYIEVIGLEFTHFEAAVAVVFIQSPQAENRLLIAAQDVLVQIHVRSPFLYSLGCLVYYHSTVIK